MPALHKIARLRERVRRRRRAAKTAMREPHARPHPSIPKQLGQPTAFSRRNFTPEALLACRPLHQRAQGRPGVRTTRGPRASKKHGAGTTGEHGAIRPSLRNGLRLIRDLPGVHDLLVTVACKIINPQTWHQPRGARTTRFRRPPLAPFVRTASVRVAKTSIASRFPRP